MIERIIEYCARNRLLVFVVVVFMSAWAFWALRNVPLDAIPDLSDVQVIIFTEWPGRSPDLVEDQITYPIITTLLAAPRVQFVRGISQFGLSFVYVIFEEGTDIYWARSRVLEYLNEVIGRLPEGVTPTLGPDATGVGWVFEYALVDTTGRHDLAELRTIQDWYMRYWLESVEGVAEVASVGGFVKTYQVDIDPNHLVAYNMPLRHVIEAIQRSNNDVGGRSVEFGGREYMVRGRGYIKSISDVENIPVGTDGDGTPILIRDIAFVQIGPDMRRGIAELDGQGEVVGGIVIVRYGENALRVLDKVKKKIEEVTPSLPPGVKIVTTYDRSELIKASIATLRKTLIEEMVVVSVVIIVFLLHFRSAFIPIFALPIAVLLSFIPMYYMKITSNIMSLGGIAIAIGAMVDASIVLVENVHKRLEKWSASTERKGERFAVMLHAMNEVGRPIFYSLLIIAVSFIPIFALEAQEGRLFKPLAFTKNFAMFFSAVLAITLTPALMSLLIRGKIISEERHPISRFLIRLYHPFVAFALQYRGWVILAAVILGAVTIPFYLKLGSEFMPPLNEGSILYMPTSPPGMSPTQAAEVLHTQDKLLKQFPEVERVFGKIGRARTATDPAPLSMVETVVTLKPKEEWREGMTWDKLITQMDSVMQFAGMPNIWWMPIQTRIEMLTTGIRSPLGIKVFGPDLATVEQIGIDIENALREHPNTRSVYSERVLGGSYLDFKIDREEAARYGLTVGDVEDIIETAIGGKMITQTIEGRERYSIIVRYPRELRAGIDELRRVLVPTPTRAQVPMAQLADIEFVRGPDMIKDEDAQLVGYVFVDVHGMPLANYVEEAKKRIAEKVKIPPGYRLEWAGQFKYLERAKARLAVIVPFTLMIIFFLLFMNFKSLTETLLVMISMPFALIGSIWLLYLLDYNLSVAVWVGMLALMGVAAETGVVMIVYLDEAWERRKREDQFTRSALYDAVVEGAVQRLRPKLMTVGTTILGLVPILWETGTGADVMKRIAAPMIGGLVTSTFLTLVVIPAIYTLWKARTEVREESEEK